jgi:redox-sensitive bicupin YhaK (pirin superfamily)
MWPMDHNLRRIRAIHAATREDIADLQTWRALPTRALPMGALDPFLLLNHHGHQVYPPNNAGLPFGPHPHRGFETVTFILAGSLLHRDSTGFESVIGSGGVQWMTAARGLIHAELSPPEFRARGGELEILQLWLNLPARLKMGEPRYVGRSRAEIPEVSAGEGGVRIQAVSGEWEGRKGAFDSMTDVSLAVLRLAPGARLEADVPLARTPFLYCVRGELAVNGAEASARQLVEFAPDAEAAGRRIAIEARSEATVLFGHGEPFGDPVVAYGPFVMNAEAEIRQAVEDYRRGKLGQMD